MICREPDRLAGFYEAAFGFTPIAAILIREPALAELIGVPEATARVVTLRLGEQEIALAGIWPSGRSYPRDVSGPSSSLSALRDRGFRYGGGLCAAVGAGGLEYDLDQWTAGAARFVRRRHRL